MKIDINLNIDDLKLIKYLKSINSPFISQINKVYECVSEILNNRIQVIFPQYTLHNTGHSFRIIEYMSELVDDFTKLNEFEIALLIYSGLLHDIGMAVSDNDIQLIKSDLFTYCEEKFSAQKKISNNDENLALKEFVRRNHASLSGKYIKENLKEHLIIPEMPAINFAQELAMICESHTNNFDWIKVKLSAMTMMGNYHFNGQFIACILRLGDILDIDGNRTPYNLYKLISPKGISDAEWQQHYTIYNNKKISINPETKQKKIQFHGQSNNPKIHRKILSYINWVKYELTESVKLTKLMPNEYRLFYDVNPDIQIQTEGYTFSDYKMTLEFKAISHLLMGEKIYGSKALGLRELIQNSIDSCKIRQEEEEGIRSFEDEKYIPKVKVILDEEHNQVKVKDNGTGMSLSIIKEHFLNIGVSFYNSENFKLRDFNYKPIGNFGIGFLSCFMLSKEVNVKTRHYKSSNKYHIQLEVGEENTSIHESEDLNFEGTEVILNYEDFMTEFDNSSKKVKDFLKNYFITDDIIIEFIEIKTKESIQIENSIFDSGILKPGQIKIDLKNYLNEIEGYVLIKKKDLFITKMEEINFKGKLFTYNDEDGPLEVKDVSLLQIANYFDNDNNVLNYIDIPIIERNNEEDYENALKYLDYDIDQVISKMDKDLKWITILIPKGYEVDLPTGEIEEGDEILPNLLFNELSNYGHTLSCRIGLNISKIYLFEGNANIGLKKQR